MDDEPLSLAEWASAVAIGVSIAALVLWALFWRWVRPPGKAWP
jgi:hypothetical protein